MGGAREIVIPYSPRAWTIPFHSSLKRWIVLVCHRRAGKTVALVNHLLRHALMGNDRRVCYIAPTYKQAKRVAWDFAKYYARSVPGLKVNESELRLDFPNGSRLTLYGADNPDALRGLSLDLVGFDEYAQQPGSIFTEIIRPALSDREGGAIWIGTPKGKNAFYDIYKDLSNNENGLAIVLRASQSGILPPTEIEEMRAQMTAAEYNQEMECSFTAAIKGAYYMHEFSQIDAEKRICSVPYDASAPVQTFWDIGISDSTSIVFAQMVGREVHIIDFYENNGLGLSHYAEIINSKPYSYSCHHLPHDIMAKELGTGKSRYEVLKQFLGRGTIKVTPRLSVNDGISAARNILPRCWFDEAKTEILVDALRAYTQEWDDRKKMFKDAPLHNWASHAADAFRSLSISIKSDSLSKKPKRGVLSTKYGWNVR